MSVFRLDDKKYAAVYAEESAVVDASEIIADALERSGITRAELARRLKVSRSEITALLEGERNLSVKKLARTLHQLGFSLVLSSRSNHSVRNPREAQFMRYLADSRPEVNDAQRDELLARQFAERGLINA